MELKKGTSLIELVVVIGLIALLSLAMSAIMLSTIISSNRVRRLTELKQAGDIALNQIQTLIRNSRNIESCSSSANLLTTTNPDGKTTDIYSESDGVSTRIASNSGIYITPDTILVNNFDIICQPDDTTATIFKISFDLTHRVAAGNNRENSTIHFETTTSTRND